MLLKNMDSSIGLVNGRRGVITDVLEDEETGKIHGINVKFDSISTFDEQEELIHMVKVCLQWVNIQNFAKRLKNMV